MIEEHPCFAAPADRDVKLWRYTDLPKLAAMLRSHALFFARADTLGDPFEGSATVPSSTQAMRNELLRVEGFTPEIVDRIITQLASSRRQSREWIHCNCWHMNEGESAAMWRLYTQANESICIQTTFAKLASVLPHGSHLGLIRYRDYQVDSMPTGNVFEAFVSKRRSFRHEHEVRAIVWNVLISNTPMPTTLPDGCSLTEDGLGVIVPVNVAQLVSAVHVSPTSGTWFRDVVADICAKYELEVDVRQSDLASSPVY